MLLLAPLVALLANVRTLTDDPAQRHTHYLFHDDCGERDGIGVQFDYIKVGLSLALQTQTTWIPNGHQFQTPESLSGTDYFEYFAPTSVPANGAITTAAQLHQEMARKPSALTRVFYCMRGFHWFLPDPAVPVLNPDQAGPCEPCALDLPECIRQRTKTAEGPLVFLLSGCPQQTFFTEEVLGHLKVGYDSAYRKRSNGALAKLPNRSNKTQVAVHLRRGDIVKEPSGLRLAAESLRYFTGVLAQLFSPDSGISCTNAQVVILSQGSQEDVQELVDVVGCAALVTGRDTGGQTTSAMDDLDVMAHSDILVAADSGFSQLAAAMAGPSQIQIVRSNCVRLREFEGAIVACDVDGAFSRQVFLQKWRSRTRARTRITSHPELFSTSRVWGADAQKRALAVSAACAEHLAKNQTAH
jgi:hypothetical protein